MQILKVLIEYSADNIDRTFDYLLNAQKNAKGCRVIIDFGSKKDIIGYVLDSEYTDKSKEELEEEYGFALKEVKEVIDEENLLSNELQELAYFMSKEYACPLISCLQTMLPKSLKPRSGKKVKIKMVAYLSCLESSEELTSKQREVYEYVKSHKKVLKSEVPNAIANKLIDKGYLKIVYEEDYRKVNMGNSDSYNQEYELTEDQKDVYNSVIKDTGIYLLEGVTGSGKTEVYLKLAKHYLNLNKTVIILVPEIVLTSQMAARFKHFFKDELALLHSSLSEGEKYDEYRKIKKGIAKIIIGTRSAIFAPCKDLGIIIIDEEHSESYKQDTTPSYHTIDVATFRAKQNNSTILLGSATPSLESKVRAMTGVYKQLYLKKRINNKNLPSVKIIDMNKERNNDILSTELKQQIKEKLGNKEQVIILLNRRGYAPYVRCKMCGYVYKCPKCDISLNYHKATNKLKCHYCGLEFSLKDTCPECHSKFIEKGGYGTQKVEEMLKAEFPEARIIRMDQDSTLKKDSHLEMVEKVINHEVDIIVGTQMVAKGLDFPLVTLVAVLNADAGLNASDFRASERTFQLLVQVLGRAGRKDKSGMALIQTYKPDNEILSYASTYNYDSFINKELEFRKKLRYPPFRFISYLLFKGKNFEKTHKAALDAKNYLLEFQDDEFLVLGPSIPYIAKINNEFRVKIMLKYKNKEKTLEKLKDLKLYLKGDNNIKVSIVVDPYVEI
jgi:primosomal protein N' (replication factor Y)